MPLFALILSRLSGPEVPNNPFESTLIAAEKIEVLIQYACGLIIFVQLLIALCANMIHHQKVPWLQDS
jgi:hypothetical protein